jgi:hypothetical protein
MRLTPGWLGGKQVEPCLAVHAAFVGSKGGKICFHPIGNFFDTHWLQKAASIITEEKNIYLLQLSSFLDLR